MALVASVRSLGVSRCVAIVLACLVFATARSAAADEPAAAARDEPRPGFTVRPVVEGGFFGVFQDFGSFGDDGTRVDFRRSAGQDVLSFYTRWSAELGLGKRHTIIFLYQPLSTVGTRTPDADVRFEGVGFAAGTPIKTMFSFPFYRASYLYDVIEGDGGYLALGVSGQIRDADYRLSSLDGRTFARTSDVGFVPALKARGVLNVGRSAFVGFEADGIYAPISYLNGSSNETTGAILDASVRAGVYLERRATAFLNVRYLGGGATNDQPGNVAKNWLQFFFVGLGASIDLAPALTERRRP